MLPKTYVLDLCQKGSLKRDRTVNMTFGCVCVCVRYCAKVLGTFRNTLYTLFFFLASPFFFFPFDVLNSNAEKQKLSRVEQNRKPVCFSGWSGPATRLPREWGKAVSSRAAVPVVHAPDVLFLEKRPKMLFCSLMLLRTKVVQKKKKKWPPETFAQYCVCVDESLCVCVFALVMDHSELLVCPICQFNCRSAELYY